VSVAVIRSAVVTILRAITAHGGLANIYEEEPAEFEQLERTSNGRVHFWHVSVSELPPAGGAGYVELRHRVSVVGRIGVSRDDPTDGITSDVLASNLLSAVTSTLAAKANVHPGGALDSDGVTPEPITRVVVPVGEELVPCHRVAVTYTTYEDA